MSDEARVEIEIDMETAAAIHGVGEMLHADALAPRCAALPSLAALIPAGSPLLLSLGSSSKGLGLVASRHISRGETLLVESATAWCICRSPGCDGLFTLTDSEKRVVAALPPWEQLRTLRDTLSFSAEFALRAEEAYALLYQLTALGGREHSGWGAMPETRGGSGSGGGGCGVGGEPRVPRRAQLLAAVFQCNAFCAALPEDDSPWKRALLWPLVGRLQEPGDRERLFEDAAPLSAVSALFVVGALFNHTCGEPNVGYAGCAWEEGAPAPTVRFTATRDVEPGEELFHSYLYDPHGDDDAAARRMKLLLTYRFRCACERCRAQVPAAGTPEDPLATHFPWGPGVEGALAFFERGGQYPRTESN